MNNVSVENINNLVGSLYNPIIAVNRDVKSISLDGGDPILPDENKNINIPSYDGNPGLFNKNIYNELVGKIPTKLSELQNDNNYVQDSNYVHTDNNFTTSYKDKLDDTYRKSEVYNKQESYSKGEVDNKIASIITTTFEVVDRLPEQGESNVIYLVPNEQAADNEYEEYIWVNNKWELIGTTRVDLTPYYTSEQVDQLLNPINNSVTSLQQNKLDKNLGADNANKHLGIDSSGNILPVNDVITTNELTSALQEEQKAREKQDELLQGEIDTKIAPSNIIAGDNINVSQQGLDVTVSASVPKYTAGTNMEITEDNVINNTIPYEENVEGNVINIGKITNSNNNNVNIGLNVENYSNNSVLVGNNNHSAGANTLVIGNNTSVQHQDCIVLGHNASTSMKNQLSLGSSTSPIKEMRFNDDNATRTQVTDFVNVINNLKTVTLSDNQLSLGSTTVPINEMKVVTSEGDKYIATKDLVKDYTAGTNIEITEQGVINNKIPISGDNSRNNLVLGYNNSDGGNRQNIIFGKDNTGGGNINIIYGWSNDASNKNNNVLIGSQNRSNAVYNIMIGHNINNNTVNKGCIFIGMNMSGTGEDYTMLVGSSSNPINNIYFVTSTGRKTVADTSQIAALETKITELESRIAALENANA